MLDTQTLFEKILICGSGFKPLQFFIVKFDEGLSLFCKELLEVIIVLKKSLCLLKSLVDSLFGE